MHLREPESLWVETNITTIIKISLQDTVVVKIGCHNLLYYMRWQIIVTLDFGAIPTFSSCQHNISLRCRGSFCDVVTSRRKTDTTNRKAPVSTKNNPDAMVISICHVSDKSWIATVNTSTWASMAIAPNPQILACGSRPFQSITRMALSRGETSNWRGFKRGAMSKCYDMIILTHL